jgi:DHA3 family macrolide efflux protein-like MFS transporter
MLKNRNFVLLWIAQCISSAGDSFTFLALSIKVSYFYSDAGESARAIGLILIAYALPQLVFSLFAGTFVDRWDRKRVMVASDLIRALIIPAFLLVQTSADLTLAFIVAFLSSTFSVFFYPARTALLPALVSEDELMTANGWMQMGNTIARLSGPILAGIAVGLWGVDVAFKVDAVSFLVSAFLIMGIMGVITKASREDGQSQSAWSDLKEGVRFAVRSRLLQGVTVGISIAMLGIGAINVLFVPFLRHTFNASAEALGVVETAQGVGMLLGGLAIGVLGKRLRPFMVATLAMLLLGLAAGSLGLIPSYSYILFLMPVAGFTLPPLNASLSTMIQRGVPGEILGRAGSVMDMATSVSNLFSMGIAGWLGDLIGLRETFVVSGIMLILGGLAMGWLLHKEQALIDMAEGESMAETTPVSEVSIATD